MTLGIFVEFALASIMMELFPILLASLARPCNGGQAFVDNTFWTYVFVRATHRTREIFKIALAMGVPNFQTIGTRGCVVPIFSLCVPSALIRVK